MEIVGPWLAFWEAVDALVASRLPAHLRDDVVTPEEQTLLTTYAQAAWEHCASFCNRTVAPTGDTLALLIVEGVAVRAPMVVDQRFLAAVLLVTAWLYANREDTAEFPKAAERMLWPLRASLGI